ncbi:MAG: hypothetical protein Q4C70_04975 [Planctomycetia bacterium]|nr:hypothetical protein [Planctomycetia bacterium]
MGKFFSWLGDLIKLIFNGIIGFFVSIWEAFWKILTGIGHFFVDCWEYLWNWVQWAYYSAIDWILRQFVSILDIIIEACPIDVDLSGASGVLSVMYSVDMIFPVDTILSCMGIYFVCLVGWCVYKFIKSWIPTVSG